MLFLSTKNLHKSIHHFFRVVASSDCFPINAASFWPTEVPGIHRWTQESWGYLIDPRLPGCHVNNKVKGKPIQLLSCRYLMPLDISHQVRNTLPNPIDGVFECGFIYAYLPSYAISHHPTSASASPIVSHSFPAWFWSCLMCNALLSARNWAKRSRTLVVV